MCFCLTLQIIITCLLLCSRKRGLALVWVSLGLVGSVWVLDFLHERFHNASPVIFSMFIKAGTGSNGKAYAGQPWLSENVSGKMSLGSCAFTH